MICHTWLDFYVGELLPVLPAIRITNQWLVILLFLTPAVPKVLWKFTDGEINFYHIATSTIKVCAIKSTGLVVLNRSSGYCLSDKQTSDHAIVLQIIKTFTWHDWGLHMWNSSGIKSKIPLEIPCGQWSLLNESRLHILYLPNIKNITTCLTLAYNWSISSI